MLLAWSQIQPKKGSRLRILSAKLVGLYHTLFPTVKGVIMSLKREPKGKSDESAFDSPSSPFLKADLFEEHVLPDPELRAVIIGKLPLGKP